jgi:hypothetical protein
MASPGPVDGSDESDNEESGNVSAALLTRMAEESSEEDLEFSRPKVREIYRLLDENIQHVADLTC